MLENDGRVFASLLMSISVMKKLTEKKLFTEHDASDIIDDLMLRMEEMGTTDPVYRSAHGVLEQLLGEWRAAR